MFRRGQCIPSMCANILVTPSSSSVYGEAQSLSETLDAEDKSASTLQRIKARVGILERAAMASSSFAVIQHSKVNSLFSRRNMNI